MKKNKLRTALCLLLAGTVLTAFAALASDAGGQDNPLVTLSYLQGPYLRLLLDEVDEKLERSNQALLADLGASGVQPAWDAAFVPVALSAGQVLRGTAGCEILFRSVENALPLETTLAHLGKRGCRMRNYAVGLRKP